MVAMNDLSPHSAANTSAKVDSISAALPSSTCVVGWERGIAGVSVWGMRGMRGMRMIYEGLRWDVQHHIAS